MTRTQATLETLLHRQTPGPQPWKSVTVVLVLAFAVRAAIALSNDFVLHPDEIMQYLEPAHRLVFGNGIQHWEYFYGARSWLIPGAIAGILKIFDAVGLGQPFWYVGGVKLTLCAISLTIPASMYVFARRHFGEHTARMALVAGALWYELAGFAHKPMAEFLATAPFMALLAMAVRPSVDDRVWWAPILAVLTAALRMQYAPLALAVLGVVFLRSRRRLPIALIALGGVLAVGIFDAVTWNGGLFHSYILNLRFNLIDAVVRRIDESPSWTFLLWLALASGGLFAVVLVAVRRHLQRYVLVLSLIALALILHSLQAHKEYRFIFVVIPLWLVIGADIVTRAAKSRTGTKRLWVTQSAAALFLAISVAGILNLLPYQQLVYFAWSYEPDYKRFLRGSDPAFAAYRYLARKPGVQSVWHHGRGYAQTLGYYYLHRNIPFYAEQTKGILFADAATLHDSVSHIVTRAQGRSFPGYSLEKAFGRLRIMRRDRSGTAVRTWHSYKPILVHENYWRVLRRIDPLLPAPPPRAGIRFSEPAASSGAPTSDRLGEKR